jgi:hypothetical protein
MATIISISGARIPIDVWEEIFHAVHMDEDCKGLRQCPSLTRTTLGPRVFRCARIPLSASLGDIQDRLQSVASWIRHLIIESGASDDIVNPTHKNLLHFWSSYPSWDTGLWDSPSMRGFISAHFSHVHTLSLAKIEYKNLEIIYAFLYLFPALRKLRMLQGPQGSGRVLEAIAYLIPPDEKSYLQPAFHPMLRLEDIELDHSTVYPIITYLCCPILGAGSHLKRLRL